MGHPSSITDMNTMTELANVKVEGTRCVFGRISSSVFGRISSSVFFETVPGFCGESERPGKDRPRIFV